MFLMAVAHYRVASPDHPRPFDPIKAVGNEFPMNPRHRKTKSIIPGLFPALPASERFGLSAIYGRNAELLKS
jgi:hypothetical protein